MKNLQAELFPALEHGFRKTPKRSLIRHISLPSGRYESAIPKPAGNIDDPLAAWWTAYLEGKVPTPRPATKTKENLTITELFCGPGGLAQGVKQACHELNYGFKSLAAVDVDKDATTIYQLNHKTKYTTDESIADLVNYEIKTSGSKSKFKKPPTVEERFLSRVSETKLLLAGPPCQGHSNLNNKTRRDDPRNELYLTVPALAIAAGIPGIIIENVTAVVHDRSGVVEKTRQLLENAGYFVDTGVLKANNLGWPQTRGRFFLIARKDKPPVPISEVAKGLKRDPLSVLWAINDLADREHDDFLNRKPKETEDTIRRIKWLFDNDEYNLALDQRPDCHKEGTTYTSCYGRMFPDKPAPTLTTGFMTPGRGRFVHPTRRRVLTPLEAARIQGFPDTYNWVFPGEPRPKVQLLAKWLGDAVPMPLGYAAALSLLGPGPLPDPK